MVGPGEVDDELQPEVEEECQTKYGEVSKVIIFEVGQFCGIIDAPPYFRAIYTSRYVRTYQFFIHRCINKPLLNDDPDVDIIVDKILRVKLHYLKSYENLT